VSDEPSLRGHFDHVAGENAKQAIAQPGDLRLATNAIMTLDGFFGTLHTKLHRTGIVKQASDDACKEMVARYNTSYRVLRDMAYALEHGTLTRKKPRPTSPSCRRCCAARRSYGRKQLENLNFQEFKVCSSSWRQKRLRAPGGAGVARRRRTGYCPFDNESSYRWFRGFRAPSTREYRSGLMSAYSSSKGTLVPLAKVRPKPGWQSALYLQDETVKKYVDQMQKGDDIAPIEVEETKDGFYLILNGYHRFVASQRCLFTEISIEITQSKS
jgi:ParB-like nuclease domain